MSYIELPKVFVLKEGQQPCPGYNKQTVTLTPGGEPLRVAVIGGHTFNVVDATRISAKIAAAERIKHIEDLQQQIGRLNFGK